LIELESQTPEQTRSIAARLAETLFAEPQSFLQLSGTLGAGKSEFARGFIERWIELSQEPKPESITSPTYTLVQTYGKLRPLAHFDLYRLEDKEELAHIGFETYFYESACCLVEWLEKIPNGQNLRPPYALSIEIEFKGVRASDRMIRIKGLKKSFSMS
jgi:tRNA threonylcarbamoyl adenosine modification protein YjeE